MKLTKEEFDRFQGELKKISILMNKGEITKQEMDKREEEIFQKMLSYENYFEYDNLEGYYRKTKKIVQRLSRKSGDQRVMLKIHREINHEREHAEVNKKYNLPTTYCFFYHEKELNKDYGFQTMVRVKNCCELTKEWSEDLRFKHDIDTLCAPQSMSKGDKEDLIFLKELIAENKILKDNEKEELIETINKQIEKFIIV
ncbi:MAG: hypothetical protein PHE43_01535 [Candidatus Nanoarchaeia archaeon]|nr:hypothetical protein [Candidatus Nanoarchaeia archaeon]